MPEVKEETECQPNEHMAPTAPPCLDLDIKCEGGSEEPLSNDPNELKKQRRLIRNRMSAQLHRERKKVTDNYCIFFITLFEVFIYQNWLVLFSEYRRILIS